MAIPSKFVDSKTAKEAGWFSRRHETDEAHRKEKAKRKLKETK